jgi:hypothetical protein
MNKQFQSELLSLFQYRWLWSKEEVRIVDPHLNNQLFYLEVYYPEEHRPFCSSFFHPDY